jgi:hypothetical protein
MKLDELLEVVNFSFDYADDEFDCTFYADAINNKYSKLIEVERVDTDYVLCHFTKFIEENRNLVNEYIKKYAVSPSYAEKVIQGLDEGEEWAYCEMFDGGWISSMLEEEE